MQALAASDRAYWHVACAGATPNMCATIHALCGCKSAFRFCGHCASTAQLVREISPAPDIVLMDDALINRHGLSALAQLHRDLPRARTLLIADSLQPSTVFAALRLGTWGVLPRMRVEVDVDRALAAIAADELWLTRRQFAAVMRVATAGVHEDFTELTVRENAVMRRVLVGQSNKQIARTLNIAEHTVKIHLHHAYGKLRVHSRVELLLHYRCDSDRASREPARYLN
jgi:two-component system nitrate/nitrite response regulator NarL